MGSNMPRHCRAGKKMLFICYKKFPKRWKRVHLHQLPMLAGQIFSNLDLRSDSLMFSPLTSRKPFVPFSYSLFPNSNRKTRFCSPLSGMSVVTVMYANLTISQYPACSSCRSALSWGNVTMASFGWESGSNQQKGQQRGTCSARQYEIESCLA